MLGVLDLPPEVMPLAALFGPILAVFITVWTSPKTPEDDPKPDTTVTDH